MTPEPPETPIAVKIFTNVTTYSKALADGSVALNKPLADTTPIIIFCQNFFLQFFEHIVDSPIEAIDREAKEASVTLRQKFAKDASKASLRTLLAVFEELCDEWAEVLGLNSGFLREDLLEFHLEFLPVLFDAIAAWATEFGDKPLLTAAIQAKTDYAKGLTGLRKARAAKSLKAVKKAKA